MSGPDRRETTLGLAATAGAFLLWGLSPIFWKFLAHVPASELLAHRISWSALLMVLVTAARRRMRQPLAYLRPGPALPSLLASTVLIASNWLLYIWAVTTERILEASLGYFVNPLVSVLLGLIVLRERLRRPQWIAVGVAASGVGVLVAKTGEIPAISLALAATFGLYGLLRKTVAAGPIDGLAVETWLLAPWTVGWLVVVPSPGAFRNVGVGTDLLLVATGLMTAIPLLLFAAGARRLPLSTVGLLQYLAPTLQFLLAVLVYGEPFDRSRAAAFVLIWIALGIYTVDARRAWKASAVTQEPSE